LVWGITGQRLSSTPEVPEKVPVKRRLLVGLSISIFAITLMALIGVKVLVPPKQVLAGFVRDEAGDPLAGVEVSLPAFGTTTASDALGRFELFVRAPRESSVELMARASGYRTHEQFATLGNKGLEFEMVRRQP
jgi:hypothetical protein